jgi:hypothetical protein
MSRGVGSLQRQILDRLGAGGATLDPRYRGHPIHPKHALAKRGYVSSYELAHSIRGAEPTRSDRSAVQRAVRNLEKRGLVELTGAREGELWTRATVSDEQIEAEWLEVNRNRAAHVPPLPPLADPIAVGKVPANGRVLA